MGDQQDILELYVAVGESGSMSLQTIRNVAPIECRAEQWLMILELHFLIPLYERSIQAVLIGKRTTDAGIFIWRVEKMMWQSAASNIAEHTLPRIVKSS